MTLSDRTLTLLALIAIGLSVLAILFIDRGRARGARRTGGRSSRATTPSGRCWAQDRAAGESRPGAERHRQESAAADRGRRATRGLLRYDAFEDVGGRLSFSCALLDEHGNGVVLTSINGRQETRVYAKPVTAGTSSYNLSSEEDEAIRQAMADEPRRRRPMIWRDETKRPESRERRERRRRRRASGDEKGQADGGER